MSFYKPVIGDSCCQTARQLPVWTFIDNMWTPTRTGGLLPADTPLLELRRLPAYEYTRWLTASGGLLVSAACCGMGEQRNVSGNSQPLVQGEREVAIFSFHIYHLKTFSSRRLAALLMLP